MDYAVELMLDAEASEAVAALTDTIYRACGGMDLLGLGSAPHISLTAVTMDGEGSTVHPAVVEGMLSRFAAATPTIASAFQAVAAFPTDQRVVYLAPTVTAGLLAAHQALLDEMDAQAIGAAAYYRPGVWMPHCTIAQGLPAGQVGHAVEMACRAPVFHPFTLTQLRLIRVRPIQEIARWPLSG